MIRSFRYVAMSSIALACLLSVVGCSSKAVAPVKLGSSARVDRPAERQFDPRHHYALGETLHVGSYAVTMTGTGLIRPGTKEWQATPKPAKTQAGTLPLRVTLQVVNSASAGSVDATLPALFHPVIRAEDESGKTYATDISGFGPPPTDRSSGSGLVGTSGWSGRLGPGQKMTIYPQLWVPADVQHLTLYFSPSQEESKTVVIFDVL